MKRKSEVYLHLQQTHSITHLYITHFFFFFSFKHTLETNTMRTRSRDDDQMQCMYCKYLLCRDPHGRFFQTVEFTEHS